MKKSILIGFLFLAIPAFSDSSTAVDQMSEFERGFLEGKASCQLPPPSSGVVCSTPITNSFGPRHATGRTQAEALLKIDAEVLGSVYAENKKPRCVAF